MPETTTALGADEFTRYYLYLFRWRTNCHSEAIEAENEYVDTIDRKLELGVSKFFLQSQKILQTVTVLLHSHLQVINWIQNAWIQLKHFLSKHYFKYNRSQLLN